MTESDYIEATFDELQAEISSYEGDILQLAIDYMLQFDTVDGIIDTSEKNYTLVSNSDSVFDEAYKAFIAFFIARLYKKIVAGGSLVTKNMASDGIKLIGDERSLLDSIVGATNGKVSKNGYLWRLGQMSQLRDRFYNYLLQAVSGGAKINKAMAEMKPFFKSGETESLFAKYYRLYAYDSVAQVMNAISFHIAKKNGLKRFLYQGSLIKDSREFCVERAGNIFTRAEGESFNDLKWRGKIEGVSFFIAAGGYNCRHYIKWLPD